MSTLDLINFAATQDSRDTTPMGHSQQSADDQHGMQLWNEKQYGAWVMFGTTSVISAMYWMQYYYYHFWYGSVSKYAATKNDQTKLGLMNTYTMWGLAENINAITLLVQWVPTALVWILTATNVDGIIWFFVVWAGIMHYIDAIRFVVVAIIKIAGFFHDHTTAVESYSGLSKTYHVSKAHSLAYWDFAMEWMGFMVSFGMYLDLHTIIEDMEVRKVGKDVVVKNDPKKNVDDDLRF